MLIPVSTLRRIAAGEVHLAFRRWRRPTVTAGGTLLTAVGQLAIDAVDPVEIADITEADARAAGHTSLDELLGTLAAGTADTTWRVTLRWAGPDPRAALRARPPDPDDVREIVARLDRWDARSPVGAWTRATLALIAAWPARRAADLARELGMERDRFKNHVRKLKGLGLTESLEVGYRLSARGAALAEALELPPPGSHAGPARPGRGRRE